MKDKATFDQEFENKEKFPRHYFDSVAKRSQALEKERKQGDAKKSDNEDFVLSQNYPKYQDKHCFFDDELEDDEGEETKVGSVFTKPLDTFVPKK